MTLLPDMSMYLVADPEIAPWTGRSFVDAVLRSIDGGVTTVELRSLTSHEGEMLEITTVLGASIPRHVTFLIGSQLGVYMAATNSGCAIDGLHLADGDLPVELVRGMLGAGPLLGIGLSSEAPLVTQASMSFSDFATFEPVRADGDAVRAGVDNLDPVRLLAAAEVPVVVIGGPQARDDAARRGINVRGIAVGSELLLEPNQRVAAALLRQSWYDVQPAVAPAPRTELPAAVADSLPA